MNDRLTPTQRSRLMSKVHGKDTTIEVRVRSYLHKMGYRFKKHAANLPGSPDIVLPRYKAAIFIHGCFWHGHSGCKKSRLPTTRHDFWEEKRRANLERDTRKIKELINLDWRVAVVWQCSLETTKIFTYNMKKLEDWIKSGGNEYIIPENI